MILLPELKSRRLGNVVIVGSLKNSSKYLDMIFFNLELLENIFNQVAYVFVENDSKDDTKKKLCDWGKKRKKFKLISFDGLDAYEANRTVRLEITRNAYISFIKENSEFSQKFDYVIIMDMDDVSTHRLTEDSIVQSVKFLTSQQDIAAVFANQLYSYYDLWALRHETLCPFDFWHKVLITALNGKSDEAAFNDVFSLVPSNFSIDSDPIQVDSAFGGLGIYKMRYITQNKSSYRGYDYIYYLNDSPNFTKIQTCEHVSFHQGIKSIGGKLYIYPGLINSESKTTFNPSAFRSLIIK
jgi:hypothetical protein